MKPVLLRASIVLALSLPVAGIAGKPTVKAAQTAVAKPAPGKQDWLRAIRRTPEGAIVIGNPAAKVKLVEYLSLTCPHCAALSKESLQPLQRDYIAKGLVSFEVRHAVRDLYDFTASLLTRCEPPAQYLSTIEALFASQEQWMTKVMTAPPVEGFDAMTRDQKIVSAAKVAGFDGFFAARGLGAKAFAACTADDKAKDQLADMAGNSWKRDAIPGTPLIVINGTRQPDVHSWAELEPLLKAALQ